MDERAHEPAHSVCPFCGVGCGIEYDPLTGKATGWRGPVNPRGEVCPKGVAAYEAVTDAERLREPLVRRGTALAPASWEKAWTYIVDEFAKVHADHGPDALAFFASSNCTNEENYLLQKTARLFGTNNVDNCARLCHSSTVAAMATRFGAGAMTNTLDDLRESDCFLVVGANPAANHPVIFRSYLLPAIRDGTTMIHVDPRETETTKAADHHLPVRPGYDIPLLNALAAVLVEGGYVDDEFVQERTTRFDDFRTFLDGLDPAAEAKRAGVDYDDLRTAARAYGEADAAAIFTGMGTSQHHCGTDNVHALLNLALLTGNVGNPGAGVNPLRGQNNVQGASDVGALPDVLPSYESVTDATARAAVADVWGVDPDTMPAVPGLTEVEATHAMGESVHAAYVFGENPAVTEPNQSRVREKLADCFLVVHDLFRTETTEYADVVLPGSAWAEKAGTVTNTDRQVMRMRPNTTTPGDAKTDLETLQELGRRLTDRVGREGGGSQFDFDGPEAVFDELRRTCANYAGMSYDGIGDGSQRWPFPEGATEGTGVLHADRFASGSKTAEFRVVEHVDPVDSVGDDELVLTTGRVLQQFNSGAVTRRSDVLTRLRGEDSLQMHPDDATARNIEDGDRVRVTNDRGSVTVAAEVTEAIRRGTVFCTFHYAEPLVNMLIGDDLDPVAKIPEYKHSAVRVEVEPCD
ncbi:formate dehydrogenase subunit alpha [Haloarchaeobius sp. DFWS5]|uniref:formate dehydrogenase subunit alpha n=1 Tax=Haloarchaeobius sp. DFWS5 TaxID=3446114 RepID=UPI003EB6AC04